MCGVRIILLTVSFTGHQSIDWCFWKPG